MKKTHFTWVRHQNILPRLSISNKTLTRYFNQLIDHGAYLEKRSAHKNKLKMEFDFLQNIPHELKSYFPDVHSFSEERSYSKYFVRKIPVEDSSFLLVNSGHQDETILKVLQKLSHYLSTLPPIQVNKDIYHETIQRELIKKNNERLILSLSLSNQLELDSICKRYGHNGLREFNLEMNSLIENRLYAEKQNVLYFSHGDLCFSNILLEHDQIYLIDPKGAEDNFKNYRPIHYELSKISQSLLGSYDLINHDLVQIDKESRLIFNHMLNNPKSEAYFLDIVQRFGTNLKTIRLIEASLFLSLLPFHQESEKKLKAFLINSLNIFKGSE